MASLSQEFPSGYIPGTDNGPAKNIKSKDAVLCKQYIQMGPGRMRIICNQPMVMRRLIDLCTIGHVKCNSLCGEVISPKTRYVFICANNGCKGHNDGKILVICKECVEKDEISQDINKKKYSVVKRYYQ